MVRHVMAPGRRSVPAWPSRLSGLALDARQQNPPPFIQISGMRVAAVLGQDSVVEVSYPDCFRLFDPYAGAGCRGRYVRAIVY
jgi:hypothetical protein